MPSTTEGLLLVIGVIFMMIALIGGGFELSAAKIPPVGKKGRIGSAVVGVVFLALALRSIAYPEARPAGKEAVIAPPAESQPTTSPSPPAAKPLSHREHPSTICSRHGRRRTSRPISISGTAEAGNGSAKRIELCPKSPRSADRILISTSVCRSSAIKSISTLARLILSSLGSLIRCVFSARTGRGLMKSINARPINCGS